MFISSITVTDFPFLTSMGLELQLAALSDPGLVSRATFLHPVGI